MIEKLFSCYSFKHAETEEYTPAANTQEVQGQHESAECPLMFSNFDVLLKILSYCDAQAICRFSRSCARAKEFVDSNFFRLSQFEVTLDVEVTSKVTKYKFQQKWGHNHVFRFESKSCTMESMLSQMTYASIQSVTISYSCESPMYCRCVLKELSLLKVSSLYFTWWTKKSPLSNDRKMLLYIRASRTPGSDFLLTMSRMPLEVLDDDHSLPKDDDKLQELLLTVLQAPVFVEIHVGGADRTMDQCFSTIVRALEKLVDKPDAVGKCTVYILITPPSEAVTSAEVLAQQRLECVRNKLVECGLGENYEVTMSRLQHFIFLKPCKDSYVIRIGQCYRLSSYWIRFESLFLDQ